jgi:hypothetical protein
MAADHLPDFCADCMCVLTRTFRAKWGFSNGTLSVNVEREPSAAGGRAGGRAVGRAGGRATTGSKNAHELLATRAHPER